MLWLSLALKQLIPDFHDLKPLFHFVHDFVGQEFWKENIVPVILHRFITTLREIGGSISDRFGSSWGCRVQLQSGFSFHISGALVLLGLSFFLYSILSSLAFCMWPELLTCSGLRIGAQGFRTPVQKLLVQAEPETRVSPFLKLPLAGSSHNPV